MRCCCCCCCSVLFCVIHCTLCECDARWDLEELEEIRVDKWQSHLTYSYTKQKLMNKNEWRYVPYIRGHGDTKICSNALIHTKVYGSQAESEIDRYWMKHHTLHTYVWVHLKNCIIIFCWFFFPKKKTPKINIEWQIWPSYGINIKQKTLDVVVLCIFDLVAIHAISMSRERDCHHIVDVATSLWASRKHR